MTIRYTGHSNTAIPLAAITSEQHEDQCSHLRPSASSEHSGRTHHQSSQLDTCSKYKMSPV